MDLTKEQIIQIDTFLKGIGLEFVDIRHEIVDHIASDIEENVIDKTTFFKNKKLQTPFLKYMLSKKSDFLKMYEVQEKKKFWFSFKLIFSDIVPVLSSFLNSLSLIMFIAFVLSFATIQLQNTLLFLLISNILLAITTAAFMYFKFKEFGKIRLTRTYYFLLCFVVNISLLFPNWIVVFVDIQYQYYQVWFYLFFFLIQLFLCISLYKRKEQIANQYKFYYS